jgi:uncharacterized protein (TIGR02996 family)
VRDVRLAAVETVAGRSVVTDENDFQRWLDANPQDHNTRLVFADWLDERGDSRAEDLAARAFTRLSADLRAELLRGPVTAAGT